MRAIKRFHPAPRRFVGLLASLGLGLSLVSVTGSPGAAAAPAANERVPARPAGDVALTWAPLYMSEEHEYTSAEAQRLADRFDLVAAVPFGLKDHSDAMRQANPRLSLLAYSNATLAPTNIAASLPEAAFSHDARGNRIKANGWNTFLMEPDHDAWRAAADNMCRTRNAVGGFDGCLVDMLTLGIFAKNYVTGAPINPDTGVAYTEAEYRSEMVALSANLRARSPELIQVGNMVENGYRYWNSDVNSRPLALSAPGAQMEDFLRGAHDGAQDWPSLAEWKENVAIVSDFEKAGVTGLFTTKVWSDASAALAAQWQGYSMASFLMGADGDSFFAFTRSRNKAGASQTNARYTMPDNLGLPRGGMQRTPEGAYSRTFANGQALVNPSNSTITVSVPGTSTRLDGSLARGRVVLPPHSGEILVDGRVAVADPASVQPGAVKSPPAAASQPTERAFKLRVKRLGSKTTKLKRGRWTKLKAVVLNRGRSTSPRGKVKVAGQGLKSRKVRIRSLKPGAKTRVRVKVKLVRRGTKPARVVYVAGGKRAVTKVRLRARR